MESVPLKPIDQSANALALHSLPRQPSGRNLLGACQEISVGLVEVTKILKESKEARQRNVKIIRCVSIISQLCSLASTGITTTFAIKKFEQNELGAGYALTAMATATLCSYENMWLLGRKGAESKSQEKYLGKICLWLLLLTFK